MARGEQGRLRIGFVSLADYGVLPGLLKASSPRAPALRSRCARCSRPSRRRRSPPGELDFGLLLPPVSEAAALEHVVVQRERFVAALPARHRAGAGAGKLAVSELAGEPFVMVPREIAPGLYDIVAGLAARAGISLNVAQEAIQMQTVVSLVSSGLGVAIVPGVASPTSAGAAWCTARSPTAIRGSTCGSPGRAARSAPPRATSWRSRAGARARPPVLVHPEDRPDRVLDRPARRALVRPHVPRRLRRGLVARRAQNRAKARRRSRARSSTTCCSSSCSA